MLVRPAYWDTNLGTSYRDTHLIEHLQTASTNDKMAQLKTKQDFLETFEVLHIIGRGSFGIIRKVRHRITGEVLARKEISYSGMTPREQKQLTAEIQVLERLKHPNIVNYRFRQHIPESKELHLYMEYCSGGDLSDHIKQLGRTSKQADETLVWSIFAQLISALYHCHTNRQPPAPGEEAQVPGDKILNEIRRKEEDCIILHRDLKPENVFLTDGSTVKLGDFGLSRVLGSADMASTYVGTPFYMSPEICSGEKYSAKSDIWSLGCILYEMCAQEPPFPGRTQIELVKNIRAAKPVELPEHYSRNLRNLVRQCLSLSPDARPDTTQLIQNPSIKAARFKLHLDAKEKVWLEKQMSMEQELVALKQENAKLRDAEKSLELQWHTKATLAITQRVEQKVEEEKTRLWKILEEEKARLQKQFDTAMAKHAGNTVSAELGNMSLSNETSPLAQRMKPKRATRTPFTRAKTIAHISGSPMDISPVKKTPLPSALTPSRKAPQPPHSPVRGRTLVELAQSPVKWGPELGDDLPSPFLRKGVVA